MTHLGAFAERMLVHENALVKIRKDMPLDRAALIGCGVTTGLGAALNTARIRPGQTAAIIGCGGVGLSIIQGCRIAGAQRIVAIDTEEWKIDLAKTLGATDGIVAGKEDARKRLMEMTGGGVDFAFEAIGTVVTAKQAVGMVRSGGTAVFVGIAPIGTNVELHAADIVLRGKSILGGNLDRKGQEGRSVVVDDVQQVAAAHDQDFEQTVTVDIGQAQRIILENAHEYRPSLEFLELVVLGNRSGG